MSSFICYIAAALLHELGHATAAFFVSLKIRRIYILGLSFSFVEKEKIISKGIINGVRGAVLLKIPKITSEKALKRTRIKIVLTNIFGPIVSLLTCLLFLNSNNFTLSLFSLMNFFLFILSVSGDLVVLYKIMTVNDYICVMLLATDLASGTLPDNRTAAFLGKKLVGVLNNYGVNISCEDSMLTLNFIFITSFLSGEPLIVSKLLDKFEIEADKWCEKNNSNNKDVIRKNIFFLLVYSMIFNKNTNLIGEHSLQKIEKSDRDLLLIWKKKESCIGSKILNQIIHDDPFYANVYLQIDQIINGEKNETE